MYRTKKEVDAHVRAALSKLRSETERHLRSFTIAKLYYKINEYVSAEQYLSAYLSVKEDNDQAHKLLAHCYQRLKKPDKALQAFQRSLQLNSKQPDVLVEVCQLLLEDKSLNTNKAKYWCELAESEKVQHDAVFSLRLKLMNKDNMETSQVEELIQKEISARPNDVQLRVRLVRNYIEQSKILDAFKYVFNLEMSSGIGDIFASSGEWYNVVWLVLSKYEQLQNTKKDWEFWLLLAICLEKQVHISFTQKSNTNLGGLTETANLLFNFDQYLFRISQLSEKFSAQKELVALFLNHYRGQLLLHASALIFRRELQQNKNKWKETVKSVLPLLLLAFQVEAPDNKEPWMKHCDEQGKQLIQQWNREGSFRCAQVGRTLLSCIADETAGKEDSVQQINNMLGNQLTLWNSCDELLAQIRQICSDKQWRRNIFALLFCNSDQKVKEQTSLLVKCTKFVEPVFELPTYADVERYEETAQYLKPQSLQHMVYLCLANDNLAYVRAKYFSGLNFSTQNLAFCGAESLNQLDVDTFLYAAAIQAKRMLEVERDTFDNYNSGNRSAAGKPRILLFANLQGQLCNEEQANWWTAAYQVYKNLTTENLAELRANLQYGIEAVRGINGPKIDMAIVFRLGQIFVARAQDIVKPVEKAFLEARAESIYKYGLNMLKMHNKGVLEPFRKYFKYVKSNTSAVERDVISAAEDAVSYLAARYFKKAEYEELIDELAGIQLPFATYLQAEAYRKLDEANKTPKKAKRMYLDRASECLNQTLALLKNTHTDPNHPLNSIIHAELKRLQQNTTKFLNESVGNYNTAAHNNSSTYEDAEADFYADSPVASGALVGLNRSRREAAANAAAMLASPRNSELENLVKQMANTLSFVKEEIVDNIKPEVLSMRQEISLLKDKIVHLEDAMKKTRISSNPPSRDDASNVLDDLYIIEDALQNQLYQQSGPQTQLPPMNTNMFPVTGSGGSYAPQQQHQTQQQRIHTPNTMQMQPNMAAAAVYNSPIFNPNYPMNYYTPPYMMTPQGAASTGAAMLGQRNALPLPYMEAGGINFNMSQNTPLLPAPSQEGRTSNLYGLLTQQQNTAAQLPQLPMPMSLMAPLAAPPATASGLATGVPVAPAVAATATPTLPQPSLPFNKAINNQPVEKGPPANVVITSSDPLPNPNSASLQTQQPTLSVTIPSHHIKQSLVQTPESLVPNPATSQASTNAAAVPGGFPGFGFGTAGTGSPFTGFSGGSSSSSYTPGTASGTSLFSTSSSKGLTSGTSDSVVTSISTTTFTFKPQIMQAAAANTSADEKANESGLSSDFNKSGTEVEPEYDPRPDFKPIIPLPDEIEVKTGEEDEEVMFCYRAKLYRYLDNEWKERGIGDLKILKNKDGSSRILMRRDQTHKICANHKITKELLLTPPKSEAKGYIWAANDFADEQLKLEKFFVRFKLPETAKQFHDAFKQAQKEAEQKLDEQQKPTKPNKSTEAKGSAATAPVPFALHKSAVTSFATSTPASKSEAAAGGLAVKPVNGQATSTAVTVSSTTESNTGSIGVSKTLFSGLNLTKNSTTEPAKSTGTSPFANFSFGKSLTGTTIAPSSVTNTAVTTVTTTTPSPFANIFSSLGQTGPSPFSTTSLPSFQSPSLVSAVHSTATVAAADTSTTAAQNKSATSDAEDDYVPTAQFNPVIQLPDLVEVATGEENEIVLFEHRAKLLRFDKEAGEWKERGLGNIKILQDKNDQNKVRLVMRREQVHKLCCNQRLYKDTAFKYAKNSQTALSWAGQDYSENELVTEMLTVRFKAADVCQQFHEAILVAQANMNSDAEEGNAKLQDLQQKKKAEAGSKAAQTTTTDAKNGKGFGDAFKPKAGAWSCQGCYISNAADKLYCVACDSPKDETVPKKEPAVNPLLVPSSKSTFNFGFAAAGANATASAGTNVKPAFAFGAPAVATTPTTASGLSAAAAGAAVTSTAPTKPTASSGFGDQFKPKTGAWTCEGCYISNAADKLHCVACDSPKDDTVPKKETTNAVLSLSNPEQKFSFGFAAAAGTGGGTTGTNAVSTAKTTPAAGSFSFGMPAATKSEPSKVQFGSLASASGSGDASKSFTFTPPTATSSAPGALLTKPAFTFSLSSKSAEPTTSAGESSTPFSLDKKDFSFTMKPKSPGKSGKSPLKFGGGGDADEDGDDGHYEEEENNTYFTPVIPLPEKIDVKTGEENEEVLYMHRAKLYRFNEGEWKERGLGDLKILRHKETHKLRVVMRRDQVLKICLNHALNADVEYKRKDDKSWLFVVNDFTEGAVELEKFSLRFKNKNIAEDFMEVVKSAIAGTAVAIEAYDATTAANNSMETPKMSTDTTTIADADKQTADKLKLPHEFFAVKPKCGGCRGCDPDQYVFPTRQLGQAFGNEEEDKKPLSPLQLPALTLPKSNRSLLKQSALSPAAPAFTTAAGAASKTAQKTEETFFGGFGGANSTAFGTVADKNKSAASTFSFTAALNSANKTDETKAGSGGFLFGGTGGSLFGGDKKPAFGETPSIFGNATKNGSSSTATEAPKSIFGSGASTGTTSTAGSSIFGGKPVFGGSPSIFGGGAVSVNKPDITATHDNTNKSIFGNNSNNTTQSPGNGAGNSIFGSSSSTLGFGFGNKPSTQTSIFGGATNNSPAATTKTALFSGVPTADKGPTFADLSSNAIDFASLAAKASTPPTTKPTAEKPGPGGFIGLTNEDAFSSFLKSNANNSASLGATKSGEANASYKSVEDEGSATNNDENYDPHYEPIIALPNEIVVSTGEEEETKLFGERATLFRWDDTNKEWKERGVGELKILLHPTHQTYRLVMRREQIHKLVLNHGVGNEFTFKNMNNNPKSFVWATMNYAESPEGELEKLAVRFKKVDLAERFSAKLNECIEAAKNHTQQ